MANASQGKNVKLFKANVYGSNSNNFVGLDGSCSNGVCGAPIVCGSSGQFTFTNSVTGAVTAISKILCYAQKGGKRAV